MPCSISICSPHGTSPWRPRWQASGPAAEPGRRVLAHPVQRREHPHLPARSRARERERADEVELGERAHVRLERGDVLLRRERDERVPDAVVVDLDRQLGRGRRRAPRAARPRGRRARPSAPAASSSRRRSARTRPARARPGRSRRPSRARSRRAAAARRARTRCRDTDGRRTAISLLGVKIRIRTVPPSRGGSTKTRLARVRARAPAPASSPRRGRARR